MMLLLLVIAVPVLGVIVLTLTRGRAMTFIGIAVTSVVLALSVLGLREVVSGVPIVCELPSLGIYTPCLHVDSTSAIFVFLTALVWFAVSLYAPGYVKHERRVLTFYVCFLITFAAVLGVFLAGDFLTLLLCFEVMTVASFFWVFHRQDPEAVRASYLYLFFGIFAGLCLTTGIVLLGAGGGSPRIGVGVIESPSSSCVTWGLVLLVVGFGMKAGMVPFHVWLPHAHSVAITPGSALLSGVLIKAGAYGLIRTGELAGFGMPVATNASWLGPALVAFGVVTMLLGVVLALFQSNAKKLLAYHSISQMGYIILGLGVGLFMGSEGSLGLAGAIYHVFNHALFKSVLFLGVGIVYIRTGEIDLYRMGGLWRKLPVTALLMLVAALGIAGVPGLNGYASKTLLHHAVSAAAQTGMPLMIWAEWLFLLVGVGTAASFAKLIYLTFLGRQKSQLNSVSTGSLSDISHVEVTKKHSALKQENVSTNGEYIRKY
jgi:hydrogenase-4 component B